jgi:O-methyltransferase involved in polyketide biosynthesis
VSGSPHRGSSTLRGINTSRPNAARVYDWYLGGGHHWAIDRYFGRHALEIWPAANTVAQHQRGWVSRVVRTALKSGIAQFLDLGSGFSTPGSVQNVIATQHRQPRARVVAVDWDPLVVAHVRTRLEQTQASDWSGIAEADLRNPAQVLAHPETTRLLDLSQPVCVLLGSVLHYVPGTATVPALLAEYRSHLVPGSWIALSHLTAEHASTSGQAAFQRFCAAYDTTLGGPLKPRTRHEIGTWLSADTLLAPGLVAVPDWRPDRTITAQGAATARPYAWCAVIRIAKPNASPNGPNRPGSQHRVSKTGNTN